MVAADLLERDDLITRRHGLGTFVGWAAFAVMGISWYLLASIGFPTRGFGLVMAKTTWWLMVLGVELFEF